MSELPDITVYLEALDARVTGQAVRGVRLASPFVVRSVAPPIRELVGKRVLAMRRLGKRIVFVLQGGLFLVVHLMIAGRLRWKEPGTKVPGKLGLLALDFANGTLLLTEASTKKRASIHLVEGEAALVEFDRGGLEVMGSSAAAFREALLRENHTLKRALTDPRLFSGIGNAYSDEILHAARLSPVKLTRSLKPDEIERLHHHTQATLAQWTETLRQEVGGDFPKKVTAFRLGMAVHGRFKKPCPVCGTLVQRIVHAENENNYCPRCQTGGKLLADRSLSRLLKDDWPKTVEEWEDRRGGVSSTPRR